MSTRVMALSIVESGSEPFGVGFVGATTALKSRPVFAVLPVSRLISVASFVRMDTSLWNCFARPLMLYPARKYLPR
jgi:hypothetical protein